MKIDKDQPMATMMQTNAAAVGVPKTYSLRLREIRTGYLFILPWVIGFLLFTAGPMLASLYLSFTDYNVIKNADPVVIGGRNYSDILSLQDKQLTISDQTSAQAL